MGAFLKKNLVTVLIVLATVVLAGIAIYTAIRLYQLRQTSVAPNAPTSQPAAFEFGVDCTKLTTQEECNDAECSWNPRGVCRVGDACLVSFDLAAVETASPSASPSLSPSPSASASASPSGSATASPTATPTSTPQPTPLSCGDTCTSNADCTNNMVCSTSGGVSVCRNPSCLSATSCICATATPVAGVTPEPELPVAGISYPTIIGVFAGIILLVGALMLAL